MTKRSIIVDEDNYHSQQIKDAQLNLPDTVQLKQDGDRLIADADISLSVSTVLDLVIHSFTTEG